MLTKWYHTIRTHHGQCSREMGHGMGSLGLSVLAKILDRVFGNLRFLSRINCGQFAELVGPRLGFLFRSALLSQVSGLLNLFLVLYFDNIFETRGDMGGDHIWPVLF